MSRLEAHDIEISMSRSGNSYDNAKAESFMKTLKAEEVKAKQYRNLEEVRQCLRTFLEDNYNQQRLHSALNYRTPVEFENNLIEQQARACCSISNKDSKLRSCP